MPMKDRKVREDEILEKLYMKTEEGKNTTVDSLHALEIGQVGETLSRLEEEGLVKVNNNDVSLTEKGRQRAMKIVRRHRLAEVLFHEVFDLEKEKLEGPACTFEHIISEELVDRICSFLGHPTHCPHGMPIPRGECCKTFIREIKPLVERLSDMPPGTMSTIHYIVPSSKRLLHKLTSLGLHPGAKIKLVQKSPAFVVEINGTIVAVDKAIADNVYVISQ